MKKLCIMLVAVCLGASLFSCAYPGNAETKGAEYAYLAVLEMFWYKDSLIVADLAGANIENKEAVYNLMEDFCRGKDTSFLRYQDYETADIPYSTEIEVVLLSFKDNRLTKSKLVTEVAKTWPQHHNEGYGILIIVKKQNDEWTVSKTKTTWIS